MTLTEWTEPVDNAKKWEGKGRGTADDNTFLTEYHDLLKDRSFTLDWGDSGSLIFLQTTITWLLELADRIE
jgi:hypothetical protein